MAKIIGWRPAPPLVWEILDPPLSTDLNLRTFHNDFYNTFLANQTKILEAYTFTIRLFLHDPSKNVPILSHIFTPVKFFTPEFAVSRSKTVNLPELVTHQLSAT